MHKINEEKSFTNVRKLTENERNTKTDSLNVDRGLYKRMYKPWDKSMGKAQNGCYDNTGCLATAPINLHFGADTTACTTRIRCD